MQLLENATFYHPLHSLCFSRFNYPGFFSTIRNQFLGKKQPLFFRLKSMFAIFLPTTLSEHNRRLVNSMTHWESCPVAQAHVNDG